MWMMTMTRRSKATPEYSFFLSIDNTIVFILFLIMFYKCLKNWNMHLDKANISKQCMFHIMWSMIFKNFAQLLLFTNSIRHYERWKINSVIAEGNTSIGLNTE